MYDNKVSGRLNRLCYSLMLFLGIYLAIYQSSMTYITEGMTGKGKATGILVALHFMGIMAGPVTLGEIGDKTGKKKVLITAFILILAGMGMVVVSSSVIISGLGLFLIGCGSGSIESLGSSILADANPGNTNKVLNLSQVFFSLGAVLGPFVTLYIMNLAGQWRYSYAAAFVMFFVMLVLTLKTTFVQKKKDINVPAGKLFSIKALKDGYFRVLCISIFLYVGIEGAAAFWITSYFSDVLSAADMGTYALSGFWGLMIIGRILGSKIKSNTGKVMNISILFSVGAVLLGVLVKTPITGILGFSLLGFGFAVIWPVLITFASKRFPDNTGSAVGIMMMFSAAGGMIIPVLIGIAADHAGISTGLMIIPVVLIAMFVLQLYGRKY